MPDWSLSRDACFRLSWRSKTLFWFSVSSRTSDMRAKNNHLKIQLDEAPESRGQVARGCPADVGSIRLYHAGARRKRRAVQWTYFLET